MKYCTNCGTQIPEDAAFCEECGTKQDSVVHEESPQEASHGHQTSFTPNNTHCATKRKFHPLIAIIAILVLLAVVISVARSCSSPETLEDVSTDFAEALLIDFDAKKVVSLMSEKPELYLIEQDVVWNEEAFQRYRDRIDF